MISKYKEYVLEQLIKNPETRNDDKLLIRNIVRDKYGTTDINELLKYDGNMFEGIRRARQKVQETNPKLRANKNVRRMRAHMEEIVREEVR